MIPRYYDTAPYQDVVEHCRKYLDARLIAVEAMLKTIREESEQPTEFVVFKDSAMIKEWEVRRKGSDEAYRPEWKNP
jgi:hypothetical protein|nr:MAG TPA: hypothetical protein [Caudoviricetes sp.]